MIYWKPRKEIVGSICRAYTVHTISNKFRFCVDLTMRKYEMKEIHKLKLLPHSFLPSSHNSHLTQSFSFNVYSFSFFIHMYTAYIPYNIFPYTQHLRHYKMSVKCLYLHLYKMLQTFHFNSSSSWLFHSAHTNSLYIC